MFIQLFHLPNPFGIKFEVGQKTENFVWLFTGIIRLVSRKGSMNIL